MAATALSLDPCMVLHGCINRLKVCKQPPRSLAAGSDSDKIMDTPVQQEIPQSHARQYTAPAMTPQIYAVDPMQYNSMGPGSVSMAMRANSPEMPTILETNSQPAPDSHTPYAPPAGHDGPQSTWNPTNSWLPTSEPALNQGGSLTGLLITPLSCTTGTFVWQVCICWGFVALVQA